MNDNDESIIELRTIRQGMDTIQNAEPIGLDSLNEAVQILAQAINTLAYHIEQLERK